MMHSDMCTTLSHHEIHIYLKILFQYFPLFFSFSLNILSYLTCKFLFLFSYLTNTWYLPIYNTYTCTCSKAVSICNVHYHSQGMETLTQLLDILTYFHHSCPAPHILCIQFSFNLPDIH